MDRAANNPDATGSRAAKRAEAARPRFSEREGRLLLAAVYQAKRSAPHDADWRNLYKKLDRIWGDR